jgi:hypothetical protein
MRASLDCSGFRVTCIYLIDGARGWIRGSYMVPSSQGRAVRRYILPNIIEILISKGFPGDIIYINPSENEMEMEGDVDFYYQTSSPSPHASTIKSTLCRTHQRGFLQPFRFGHPFVIGSTRICRNTLRNTCLKQHLRIQIQIQVIAGTV